MTGAGPALQGHLPRLGRPALRHPRHAGVTASTGRPSRWRRRRTSRRCEHEGFDADDWPGAGPGDLVLAVRADVRRGPGRGAGRPGRGRGVSPRAAAAGAGAEPDPRTHRRGASRAWPGATSPWSRCPATTPRWRPTRRCGAGLRRPAVQRQRPRRGRGRAQGPGPTASAGWSWARAPGTAMLGRHLPGLRQRRRAARGRAGAVGVVAAAGTGAQEAAALLDRFGVGVTARRRASAGATSRAAVGGLMGQLGVARARAPTRPPRRSCWSPSRRTPRSRRAVIAEAGDTPLVAALIGLDEPLGGTGGVVRPPPSRPGVLGHPGAPRPPAPRSPPSGLRDQVEVGDRRDRRRERTLVRGPLLRRHALLRVAGRPRAGSSAPVWSNTPLDKRLRVPAPAGSHVCLDLGEEEYTAGPAAPDDRPRGAHRARCASRAPIPRSRRSCSTSSSGTARTRTRPGELAPACAEIAADGGPQVVVYVLGTEQDPQGFERAAPGLPRRRVRRHRDGGPGGAGRRRDRASRAGARRAHRPATPAGRRSRSRWSPTPPRPAAGWCTRSRWPRRCTTGGRSVHLVTQGDPGAGLFRPTTVPHTVLPAPARTARSTDRVFASIDALAGRAATGSRTGSTSCTRRTASPPAPPPGSATPARRSRWCAPCTTSTTSPPRRWSPASARRSCEPDRVLVVSEYWRRILRAGLRDRGHRRPQRRRPGPVRPDRPPSAPARAAGPDRGARTASSSSRSAASSRARAPVTRSRPSAGCGGCPPADARGRRRALVPGLRRLPRGALAALPGLGLRLGEDVVLLGTRLRRPTSAHWYRSGGRAVLPLAQGGLGARGARGHGRRPAGGRGRSPGVPGVPPAPPQRADAALRATARPSPAR